MAIKKAVIATHIKSGKKREFESARKAARTLFNEGKKVSRANIVFICIGKPVQKGKSRPNPTTLTQSGGYKWEYKK